MKVNHEGPKEHEEKEGSSPVWSDRRGLISIRKPLTLFINPQTKLLRSGWRLLVFVALFISPALVPGLLTGGQPVESSLDIGIGMILTYPMLITWIVLVSWFCLRFLDQLGLASLGFKLYHQAIREVALGCAIAAAMVITIVALQWLGGGTRLMLNPQVWAAVGEAPAVSYKGLLKVATSAGGALMFFILAGAFEELLFRGYPFQTLLRGAPAIVPMLLLSIFFGLGHWDNPNRTIFSTVNTVLAGIWLSVAYLKTRSLWFPTALHLSWNWTLGAFFGLPVSGITISSNSILVASSEAPAWLTGGSYGSEGGAAATVVLLIATFILWRARWLQVAPEMEAALKQRVTAVEPNISLGLKQD